MNASLHDRPDAVELVDAVSNMLERRVLPADSADIDIRHDVRVAINILRIVARQLADETFEAEAEAQLRSLLTRLSGTGEGDSLTGSELLSAIARRIDDPDFDPSLEREVRIVIKNLVVRKLTAAKPGNAPASVAKPR